MRSDGFTLVELIIVIALLGILAAFALPRFVDLDTFRVRAAYDEVSGVVRYAQKLAVASGCEVRVLISANGYALQQHATDCTTGAFTDISSSHPVYRNDSVGVSLTPRTFAFDAMGRTTGTTITVGGSETITVVAETGYVDAP